MSDLPATKPDPIDQVFIWILEGAAEHEIIESIAKFYPESKPKPLIVAAFQRIAKTGDADATAVRGWCIEASRMVMQKAMAAGDFATALRAIKQISALSA